MSETNHWWTTRPKRKLTSLVDVLRVFLIIAEGKKWEGNRTLHLEFEEALEDKGLKGVGKRRDGTAGGGRTYAGWLSCFGLWFEDEDGIVRSTFAGDDLLKGADPVSIITTQIINFQHPSPFTIKRGINPSFNLFPFRFILNLLLDPKLEGYLTENELSGFIMTKAETDRDLPAVTQSIIDYRKSGNDDSIFDDKFIATYGGGNRKDTANTLVNQLEFTQLITREGKGKFIVTPGKEILVKDLLKNAPPLIKRTTEYELFQRKYGLGPNHKKDTRKFNTTSSITAHQAEKSKVLLALWDILSNHPVAAIDKNVLDQISRRTGVAIKTVETIIVAAGISPSYDVFEQKYLQLSVGGTKTAKEFEQATELVFGKEGLNYYTEWIGAHPNNPDVLGISEEVGEEYCCILDAKAYKSYSIDGDQRRRMVHVYIPKYKTHKYNGKNFDLAFFGYVAGGLGNTIDKGIESIYKETGVSGFAVTAKELLLLLRQHRDNPFSKAELRNLFTINRRILPSDFTK